LSVGIAAVKWAIENSLIQQAYTALDETIKLMCVKNLDMILQMLSIEKR